MGQKKAQNYSRPGIDKIGRSRLFITTDPF